MARARRDDARAELALVLERARAGSDVAFEAIFHELAPAVAGYLRLNGVSEVDELDQRGLRPGAPRPAGFTGDWAGFRSWVFTIAHHRMVDDARRARRRPPVAMAEVSEEAATGDVESEALDALSDERLHRLLSILSDDQRQVLLLRVVADLPLEEAADALGQDRRRGEVPPAPSAGLAATGPRAGRGRPWLLTRRLGEGGAVSRRGARDAFDEWMARFAELDDDTVDDLLRGNTPEGYEDLAPVAELAVAVRARATAHGPEISPALRAQLLERPHVPPRYVGVARRRLRLGAAAAAAVAVVGVAAAQNALPASAQRFVSSAADLVGIHVPHPDDDDGAPSVTTVDGPRYDLGRRRSAWRPREGPRRRGHHGLRGARRHDDGRHPWAVLDGWAARRDPRRGHAGRSRHSRRPRAGDARGPASTQRRRRQRPGQRRPGPGPGSGSGQGNAGVAPPR